MRSLCGLYLPGILPVTSETLATWISTDLSHVFGYSHDLDCFHSGDRPQTGILFVKVVSADQALKLALGSTVITLWVVFFAIAVIVSLIGIHLHTHV